MDYTEIPDQIIDKALASYKYSSQASPEEKMILRQAEYIDNFGSFNVHSEVSEQDVICTLTVEGENYSVSIPKNRDDATAEVYPIGDVRFKSVDLIAVSLYDDFPWTTESFVAYYLGQPDYNTIDHEDEAFNDDHVLVQYFPPRSVSDTPMDSIVTKNPYESELETRLLGLFTNEKPNPWEVHAIKVAYEDEALAEKLLTHESAKLERDSYKLTEPNNTLSRD